MLKKCLAPIAERKQIKMDFNMRPIGIIRSPFTDQEKTPIQASRSQAPGQVEVIPEYVEGLQDLDGFSHIILLYVWHEARGYDLLVKPFLDDHLRGVFATRYPGRPNQIGISVVGLRSIHGNILEIEGVDMLDKTPLLDIKPYVPDFDIRTGTRSGWYETRTK
jgi:tRNA-Thr(GGU) m(6)t(6)A37 methyltransferase TsaA